MKPFILSIDPIRVLVWVSMRKARAVLGAVAMIVLATVLVPLELAFINVAAAGRKTQAEIVRLIREAHVLDLIFLCVSVLAGCMMFSAVPTR
jgi:hypothetical protein